MTSLITAKYDMAGNQVIDPSEATAPFERSGANIITTWATRTRYQLTDLIGVPILFSDVGAGLANAGGGTYFFWNGVIWKPISECILDTIDTANNGGTGVAAQNLNPNAATVQAGVIQTNCRLDMEMMFGKNGAVDAATIDIRFGSAFTVADALLASLSLGAADRSLPVKIKFRRASATSIQQESATTAWNSPSTTVIPSAVALAGADNFDTTAMRFSVWQTMGGTTNFVTFSGAEIRMRGSDS